MVQDLKCILFKYCYFIGVLFIISNDSIASQRYWVFFKDKPEAISQLNKQSISQNLKISDRALVRRAKLLDEQHIIDRYDMPISTQYIQRLQVIGAEIVLESRWLNGVSICIPESELPQIRSFDFVKDIRPVISYPVRIPETIPGLSKMTPQSESEHLVNYGYSYEQLSPMRVPEVHDLGLHGEGVFIGLLDSGYDTEGYRIFSKTKILNTYDFYWNDENPANEPGDTTAQDHHGTEVLSAIGGFHEGVLVGSAYGASFALGKTEWIPTETRLEEDLWVSGIEWLESLGVDIVTSSLGYRKFDDGYSYTYEDLNGDVCVTTVAADIAAKKGVLVLTSAGNEGNRPWHYILSPADGDSVIAVGAVDWNGELAYFSSVGPTSDGRIKPDVVAPGMGIYVAEPNADGTIHYVSGNGTSFASPLAAGVCALILQAHPELTPMEVREALRETAGNAANPDNRYGWGLVNAYDAVYYYGPFLTDFQVAYDLTNHVNQLVFSIHSNNQIVAYSIQFHYKISEENDFMTSPVGSFGGERFFVLLNQLPDLNHFLFYVSLDDMPGKTMTIPYAAPQRMYHFSEDDDHGVPITLILPKSYLLMQNVPNPFNGTTRIGFKSPEAGVVNLNVYNILGQKIVTLFSGIAPAGESNFYWSGLNEAGQTVSAGIYFYTLDTKNFKTTKKMIFSP